MKRPKTAEDIQALALAHLDIAADNYKIIEKGGMKKEIPESVAKAFTVHIGAACRNWIKFRKRFDKEFRASFGKSEFIGKVQHGEWIGGEDEVVFDKISVKHPNVKGNWSRAFPSDCGKPFDP